MQQPTYPPTTESFFLARQPIYDVGMNIWGYELLYRQFDNSNEAQVGDEDAATSQIIVDGLGIASHGLSSDLRILINFPEQLLLQDAAFALPAEQCVVEILETVEPSETVVKALKRLRAAGYRLAMDDYTGDPKFYPFLRLVDYIKVDVLQLDSIRLRSVAQGLKRYRSMLLAEKVENLDVFRQCKELGFSLFQGYFFCRPEMLSGRKVSTSQLAKVQLLHHLSLPDYDVAELSTLIAADLSLSYRLLRYINSASFALPNKIDSIQQAVVLLGRLQLVQWLRVVVLADISASSLTSELAYTSAKRGKFLELLAENEPCVKCRAESMFMLGLFSLLDALLGAPMAELLKELPLGDDIVQALSGERNNMRIWLDMVIELEKGNWPRLENQLIDHGLDPARAARYNAEAMAWTADIFGNLS
ncbi:MAG: EAL and HDOD domain-containing protein [Desulfovibrio sp.]|uniref:EAL and HDOD domain-containing protein n=1 Tax=Desulfovibrio sp. 7SRBS1 TaxID=3378064 RepID=UPI003B424624